MDPHECGDDRGILLGQLEPRGPQREEAVVAARANELPLLRVERREAYESKSEQLAEARVDAIRDDQYGPRLTGHQERELAVGALASRGDERVGLSDLDRRLTLTGVEAERRLGHVRDDGAGQTVHRSRIAAILRAFSTRAPARGRSSGRSALSAASLRGSGSS